MFLCDPVAPANNGLSCLAGLGKFSSSVAAKTSIHSLVLFETLSKAKGQSYKTGHAHIKYLILDTQWQIWGNTSLRYTHYTCMQYKPKKIFVNNVFLFNTHVQYKLQKFLAKPVFFAGLVFWFTAHVQYKDQKIYFAIIVPASSCCSIDIWRRHGLTRKASANF